MGPLVLQRTIATTIEIPVLREVVECIARTIKACRDVMAAIVGGQTIGDAGARLFCPRARTGLAKRQPPRYLSRPSIDVNGKAITVALDCAGEII